MVRYLEAVRNRYRKRDRTTTSSESSMMPNGMLLRVATLTVSIGTRSAAADQQPSIRSPTRP
jgi:hypothetical protein